MMLDAHRVCVAAAERSGAGPAAVAISWPDLTTFVVGAMHNLRPARVVAKLRPSMVVRITFVGPQPSPSVLVLPAVACGAPKGSPHGVDAGGRVPTAAPASSRSEGAVLLGCSLEIADLLSIIGVVRVLRERLPLTLTVAFPTQCTVADPVPDVRRPWQPVGENGSARTASTGWSLRLAAPAARAAAHAYRAADALTPPVIAAPPALSIDRIAPAVATLRLGRTERTDAPASAGEVDHDALVAATLRRAVLVKVLFIESYARQWSTRAASVNGRMPNHRRDHRREWSSFEEMTHAGHHAS